MQRIDKLRKFRRLTDYLKALDSIGRAFYALEV